MLSEEHDERTAPAAPGTAPVPVNDIQVVARTAQLLRLLTVSDSIDVASVARALGIGRSSAHRYLLSMERHGLLVRRGRTTYETGSLMMQLGAAALARNGVVRLARPLMESLRDEVQHTITLALWNGAAAVIAHVAEDTSRTAHVSVRVGRALRPEAAQTVIFTALLAGTPRRAGLDAAALDAVRRSGVAVRESREDGVRAVAVPIVDPSGAVLATLAAVGVAQLVPHAEDSDIARALTRVSRAITRALGADVAPLTDG